MAAMDQAELRRHLVDSVVARLATVSRDGKPHLIPVCFVLDGDRIFFAVDQKPKRTNDLQRLRNIAANSAVSLLVDHYESDWARLWWVRVDGTARTLDRGDEADRALDLLADRYPQYVGARPDGPVVSIALERISGWSAGQ